MKPLAQSEWKLESLQAVDDAVLTEFFSADYQRAREAFLSTCEKRGADVLSWQNPLRGLNSEPLFTDAVFQGPSDASNVVVTISGVHGPEGFCGSGIQTGLLKTLADTALPADVCLLHIHALNPYGFSWLRRVTEDNVDLCRNFIDFAKTPETPLFDDIAEILVPKNWTNDARAIADGELEKFIDEHGESIARSVIAGGQYTHPFSVHYGGVRPTWSNLVLQEIIATHLVGRRHVACLDFHTGLGPYGEGQLLVFHRPGTGQLGRARAWWGNRAAAVYDGESIAYEINGALLDGFEAALPDADVTCAAYEFGTLNKEAVWNAIRADQWLYAYGDIHSQQAQDIRDENRAAFYGDEPEWKRAVWDQAVWAIGRAILGVSADDK